MVKSELSSGDYRQSLLKTASMSNSHSFNSAQKRDAELNDQSIREIIQYLNERITGLDSEIKTNLADRKPDYEWGKRIGRITECKSVLEFINRQQASGRKESSGQAVGASIAQ